MPEALVTSYKGVSLAHTSGANARLTKGSKSRAMVKHSSSVPKQHHGETIRATKTMAYTRHAIDRRGHLSQTSRHHSTLSHRGHCAANIAHDHEHINHQEAIVK
eukprot:2712483-Amphidinium_carterae.3